MISTQIRKKLLVIVLTAAVAPTLALAHDLRLSTIDILDQWPRAQLSVRTPLSHLARLEHAPGQAISAIEADMAIRRRLHLQREGRTITLGPSTISIDSAADLITWRTWAPAPAASLAVQDPLFPEETGARLRVRTAGASGSIQDRWVVAETGGAPVPSIEYGVVATIWRFVRMGAGHIFDGPDHIAFIIGLVLLGGSLRSLLLTVTAFTLAHSITLAMAATGLWAPSARVIEPLIALSIVAIAGENLWRRGSIDRRPYYAFVFGLVHGFGLAGPLCDLGLASSAAGFALSLAPFNIGVELAQGAVVLAVWPILLWLSRRHPAAMVRAAALGSIGIGILGTFWCVDRLSPAAFAQGRDSPDTVAARIDASFQLYSPLVATRHDARFFYVESNGIPDHRMMIGITAWQQQVPLPQSYRRENAWRFPLFPRVAVAPLSAREHFFRGAIAIAANGVPIFNPIKNDGVTDTFLAGELDEFGGHCGRADDYHYHLAPLHLQKVLGTATPVAYALDGYAIYGMTEADGSAPAKLDTFNGHAGKDGSYHYHATKMYPYLNGGFHGAVVERDGQVDPQPHADPVRPAGEPLRGATITGFEKLPGNSYTLTYTIRGESRKVRYTVQADGNYVFDFIDGRGVTRSETYTRRGRGSDGPLRPGGGRRPGPPRARVELLSDGVKGHFTAYGNGTVTDLATGLMWQQSDGDEMTWPMASAYCRGLSLGGFHDWRLPTTAESFSILDHAHSNPALDLAVFPSAEAEYWWTSETRADDPSRIWVTNAGGGAGPHPAAETLSAGGAKRYHARCTRNPVPSALLPAKFTAGPDGTVTDHRNGLMWQETEEGSMTWDQALQFSKGLALAGHHDWRLPTIKELQSLNDTSVVTPSLDRVAFPQASPTEFWSATSMVNRPERAWTVDFRFGIVSYKEKTEKLRVKAVRGGG